MNEKIRRLLVFLFVLNSSIIFLLFLNQSSFAQTNEKIITGKIQKLSPTKVIVNEKIYNVTTNPLIIFKDSLGAKLINFNEIPDNINGLYKLNSNNEIIEIQISGREETINKKNIKKLYQFKENIFDFQMNYNGKLLAYFNWEENLLKIVNLDKKKIIWQTSLNSPTYSWHPKKNVLAFSSSSIEGHKICLYYPNENKIQILLNKTNFTPFYINYIAWAPDGRKIAYTILEGVENAHGYVSGLYIINNRGEITSLKNLSDVNFLTWSPTGKYLAYNQFRQTDISTSAVGIYDFKINKFLTLTRETETEINPIFTPDEKNLIYTDISGITQHINIYNIEENKKVRLKDELKYIDNFSWLNKQTLVYSFGDRPQIKLYNINNNKSEILGYGFSPRTLNNSLFFLRNDLKNHETYLYLYEY